MTDTGDLKVDGTVSATALEFDDNGTTKDVATELATLRSMIGSSGVSVAGMIVGWAVSQSISISGSSSGTSPSKVTRVTASIPSSYSNAISDWNRVMVGGEVFEFQRLGSFNQSSETSTAYTMNIDVSLIPESVFDTLANTLVQNIQYAGSFEIGCRFYGATSSNTTPLIAQGVMRFAGGQYVGLEITKREDKTIYTKSTYDFTLVMTLNYDAIGPLEA